MTRRADVAWLTKWGKDSKRNGYDMRIVRKLCWFEKKKDHFIGEEILKMPIRKLRKLFSPGENDPDMILCYRVNKKHLLELQRVVRVKINLLKYDYFVEAESLRRRYEKS